MAKYGSARNVPLGHFMAPSKAATAAAFHEVFHNVPAIVKKTARKEGAAAARRQKIAIALSKARRMS